MRKLSVIVIAVAILGVAGNLIAQQEFPNISDVPVVFENDKVVAQQLEFEPGAWAGEHSHAGNQMVVILSHTKMTYSKDGEETTVEYKPGDVFWIDATKHDHRSLGEGRPIRGALPPGSAILITFM